jgi:hypothetical protein
MLNQKQTFAIGSMSFLFEQRLFIVAKHRKIPIDMQ